MLFDGNVCCDSDPIHGAVISAKALSVPDFAALSADAGIVRVDVSSGSDRMGGASGSMLVRNCSAPQVVSHLAGASTAVHSAYGIQCD